MGEEPKSQAWDDPVLSAAAEAMARHGRLDEGGRVLVAVSGGADSVALLHVLAKLGLPLAVAHLDHQTRHGESTKDAAFVEALAERLGLPFRLERRAVAEEAAGRPESFEEYARELRYAFFRRAAHETGCAVVATGHQADDQAETVLMRLLRGSGPAGLSGIPPVREERGLRVIRPLLGLRRDALRRWLEEEGHTWREDSSNRDPAFLRNRIRNELLPHLTSEYNPRCTEALIRLADVLREEDRFLEARRAEAWAHCHDAEKGLRRDAYAGLHAALRRRLIVSLAHQAGIDCSAATVIRADAFVRGAPTGKYFDLGEGVSLYSGRTHVSLREPEMPGAHETIPLTLPGTCLAFGKHFEARILPALPGGGLRQYCGPSRQVFDADNLAPTLAVRGRRPGDRFAPFGLGGTKKLKDYFVDVGLPAPERDTHPLVTSGDDIVWVVGFAPSALAAVTPETRRFVEIDVRE